jgi:hypothetical protein
MTDTTAPTGPASASSPAALPHWRRRLHISPSVIDTAAARRLHGRIAGWAIQRLARARDLATRHASTEAGAAAGLLLARVPVQMSDEGEGEGSAAALGVGRAEGEAQPDGSSDPMAHDATPAAASHVASGLAMRLQRRVAGSGVIKVEAPGENDHKAAGGSPRSGLHGWLTARAGSAPPTMHVARRVDARRDENVGGDYSIAARPVPVTPAPSVGDAARVLTATTPLNPSSAPPLPAGALAYVTPESEPAVPSSASTAASSHDAVGTALPLPRPNAVGASETGETRHRAASALHRKVSDGHIDLSTRSMQAAASLARAREAAPTSAQHGIVTMLHLARASTSDVQPPPLDVFSRSDADAKASLSQPKHDAGPSASPAAARPAARPIITPAMIAAPALPTLVWRTTDDARTRDLASRFADVGSTGVLMRAGAEAIDGAGAVSSASASIPPAIHSDAAACAAPVPTPDVKQLAERVTRLIVRRLEVECERRGGKRWN